MRMKLIFAHFIPKLVCCLCRSLELFPKILSAISAHEVVVYAGKDMSGPDYKSHILNSLCSGRYVKDS